MHGVRPPFFNKVIKDIKYNTNFMEVSYASFVSTSTPFYRNYKTLPFCKALARNAGTL
jgi:hypothetical protein